MNKNINTPTPRELKLLRARHETDDVIGQLLREFEPEPNIEVLPLSINDLSNSELQWYAGELRRCCGDDVACEELSAIAVEVRL